jgi:hypothetical protein
MKTSELTGAALDWAVAKCEEGEKLAKGWHPHTWGQGQWLRAVPYTPSTNWEQGGPIIERERITLSDTLTGGWVAGYNGTLNSFGPTPLIAAMRCYVASELGDTIDIPEELK